MIIDVHAHIGLLPNSQFAESYEKNLKFLLSEMKGAKIDHAFIIAGFKKKSGFNIATKNLIRLIAGHKNLHVIGSIDIFDYGKKDLEELDGYLKKGEIIGIKLYTGYQHFYPADKKCEPVYRLCQKYGAPVIFHSGDTLAGYVKNPKLKYSHPLHIDDVAADWPDLKIVIAHMGNPWLTDCAEVVYKNPNVFADISGLVVGDEFSKSYGKLIKSRIQELVAYVGSNKLMYGTDWPLCPMRSYVRFAKGLELNRADQEKLFYKNALNIFNLTG